MADFYNAGKKEEKMNIVYALTRNYYHKLKPSITSLMEHNPKARVFIVCEDDTIDLPYKVEVINVSDQQYFPKGSVNYNNQFTYINLLKVCYASLLPVNKVIHLDVDTIITEPLDDLWKTDVRNKWFAACPEYLGRYKPFGEMYYNMGVALINLQQIRKDGIEQKMIEYLNAFRQPYADQDAWNVYAIEEDKAVALPIRFNECFATGSTDNPAIVHYCGYTSWYEAENIPRRSYLEKYL